MQASYIKHLINHQTSQIHIAIKPLALSVRENRIIKPITIDDINHKISLYADDITPNYLSHIYLIS